MKPSKKTHHWKDVFAASSDGEWRTTKEICAKANFVPTKQATCTIRNHLALSMRERPKSCAYRQWRVERKQKPDAKKGVSLWRITRRTPIACLVTINAMLEAMQPSLAELESMGHKHRCELDAHELVVIAFRIRKIFEEAIGNPELCRVAKRVAEQ